MNIIFGPVPDEVLQKYTVLELDTFVDSQKRIATAWCVLETIPLAELLNLSSQLELHSRLLEQYRKRNWEYCQDALNYLQGKWNREVDSFYDIFSERIKDLMLQDLPESWSGFLPVADHISNSSL